MPENKFDVSGGSNQILPNATEGNQYFIGDSAIRIAQEQAKGLSPLAQLHQEIGKGLSEQARNRVRYYETRLEGTKDVVEKLTDGGFRLSAIGKAKRLKQFWAEEALRTADYPGVQEENLQLYSRIVNEFDVYIMPMIEDEEPLRDIMRTLHEKIVAPIMDIYQKSGYTDENLRYTYDHIYGMIYYLTGNCHLNWADYDQELEP